MAGKKKSYDNESITSLKGADRVRKRPAVIFGSDGLEGCQHSFFEILSNSIDEAREGYGNVIEVTRYRDHSIEIKDHGRGIPLDYNSTGSLFSASCMPAESITTTTTECMNTVLVSTVSVPVLRSTAPNIWTLPLCVTKQNIHSISYRHIRRYDYTRMNIIRSLIPQFFSS